MSLTDLITRHPARAQVRARLDQFLPPQANGPAPAMQVPPIGAPPTLVGIAFDYAVRMELAHRAPHAKSTRWIAELALRHLSGQVKTHASEVVRAARQAAGDWPSGEDVRFAAIAEHAARLSPLDGAYRTAGSSGMAMPSPERTTEIAVDVRALLSIASPLWSLTSEKRLLLNPDVCGAMVGGADADLVAGSTIIEIKTRKSPSIERDDLRQLIGYACLTALSSSFAPIDSVAVYLSRHGVLRRFELRGSEQDRAEAAIFMSEVSRPRRGVSPL